MSDPATPSGPFDAEAHLASLPREELVQEVTELSASRAVFVMRDCRVQSARKRKGLPDFPCKSVGIVEYSEFARAVDPRIRTRCITCPPGSPRRRRVLRLGVHAG